MIYFVVPSDDVAIAVGVVVPIIAILAIVLIIVIVCIKSKPILVLCYVYDSLILQINEQIKRKHQSSIGAVTNLSLKLVTSGNLYCDESSQLDC